MAKKKKGTPAKSKVAPATLSDEKYLSSGRARSLPIYKCVINEDWEDEGMAEIFIARKHVNSHVTVGVYLVDTYCTGIKNTFYYFNIPEDGFEGLVSGIPLDMKDIPYELAHNIIYGAIAYAQDYGIAPHPEFQLTQMILKEDTEDVELIELEFGRNGKPALIINPAGDPRADYYLRQLEKHAGPGNYDVVDGRLIDDFEDDSLTPEDWEEDDWEYFIQDTSPEDLQRHIEPAVYMFDKVIAEPSRANIALTTEAKAVDFTISFDPLPLNYSTEEKEEVAKVLDLLEEVESEQALWKQVKERISKDIEKWPENDVFYHLLISGHLQLEEDEEASQAIQLLYEKFPDALRSKTLYAQLLFDHERAEEVPAIFGGHYNLKALYPNRNTFYISELVDFNMTMAEYFLKKKDLPQARTYVQVLEKIDLPNTAIPDFEVLLKIDMAIVEEMKPLLKEAQQNKEKKQELIAQLVR